MINNIFCTILLISFIVFPIFSQEKAKSQFDELILIEEFKIIDKTSKIRNNTTPTNFEAAIQTISKEWSHRTYNNEFDNIKETRLCKGKSYLHKEALEQGYLGNSAILDYSIVIENNDGVQFYVGMPISIIKEYYPESFARSQKKFHNEEGKNLVKVNLVSGVKINGEILPSDTGGLTFIYNNDSQIVERIYSRW